MICQCLAEQLFFSAFSFGKCNIDPLATDKSLYVSQPCPITAELANDGLIIMSTADSTMIHYDQWGPHGGIMFSVVGSA